jgi:acetyl-CoA/propionyl-CoA carboxylase biotin carboxyl carrier protein
VERTLPVEVDGKRFSVKVWMPEVAAVPAGAGTARHAGKPAGRRPRAAAASGSAGSGSGTITSPMQGTIVKVLVDVGATVETGQPLLVLEAMKMENNINSERAGTVQEIKVAPGDAVSSGDVLAVIG